MVRFGYLGTGVITQCHFSAVEKLKEIQVAAVASADEAQGSAASKRFNAVYYRDYRELLTKEKDLDGIVVALPNYMHYEASAAAIEAGYKNIFCEKPLCTNPSDSKKLVELVQKNGVFFQTGYMKRFNPGFRLIKEAIEQKLKLLEFVSFNIYGEGPQPVLSPSPTPPRNWHGNPKLAGGGIITHSTSHHLDLLRYTLGEVKSVSAHCRYIGDRDYYLLGRMEMENGVLVDMRLGRAELQGVGPGWNRMRSGGWDESVEAIGTGGYIKVESPTWQGYDPMTVKRWFTGMTGPEIFQVECDEQWTNELTAFAESCKTGVLNKTASSVVDGYKVDKIIETIHESNRQGGKKIDVVYEY